MSTSSNPTSGGEWVLPKGLEPLIPVEDRYALGGVAEFAKAVEAEVASRATLSLWLKDPRAAEDREKFLLRCAQDPAFFLRNCVWTRDPEKRLLPGSAASVIPLIPFRYMLSPFPMPYGPIPEGGGWADLISQALRAQDGKEHRYLFLKSRRTLMSITAMSMMVWAMRFVPGFAGWVTSFEQDAIDHGEDWDSLLGKLRFIWDKVHEYYPWMLPPLPRWGTTPLNKQNYVEFPEWRTGRIEHAKECWGNKIRGVTASDLSARGGAALFGFADEAGWIEDLESFIESVEEMTPHLVLATTAPKESNNPITIRAQQGLSGGYRVTVSHWTMHPLFARGVQWTPSAQDRGPWTRKWRNEYYEDRLRRYSEEAVSRNLDINLQGAGGARVFTSFREEIHAGSPDSSAPTFELYDPTWPLYIWYDIGRGDPWACLWVQVSDITGEVRIVDFWMKKDVTVEWWIPLWLGWNPRQMKFWKTAPERFPWAEKVPWGYNEEELAKMSLWHKRFGGHPEAGALVGHNTRRPTRVIGDFQGRQRTANHPSTVEDIIRAYGLSPESRPIAHHQERWIEHADACLSRTMIAGRIARVQPITGGVRYPSVVDCFLSWRRLEDSEKRVGAARPAHDIYSHAMTAYLYGCMALPSQVMGRWDKMSSGPVLNRRESRVLVADRDWGAGTAGSMYSGPEGLS